MAQKEECASTLVKASAQQAMIRQWYAAPCSELKMKARSDRS